MKISELIKELEDIRKEHGDIEVLYDTCLSDFDVHFEPDHNGNPAVYIW